jgi:hypothetical protein
MHQVAGVRRMPAGQVATWAPWTRSGIGRTAERNIPKDESLRPLKPIKIHSGAISEFTRKRELAYASNPVH